MSSVSLKSKLEKADGNVVSSLHSIKIKSPVVGLLLGLFFGGIGVDRFYKGDIALGIAKLIIIPLCCFTIFLIPVAAIWCLCDYFLVWKSIKRYNLEKILMYI